MGRCSSLLAVVALGATMVAGATAYAAQASASLSARQVVAVDLAPGDGMAPAYDFTAGGTAYLNLLAIDAANTQVDNTSSPSFLDATLSGSAPAGAAASAQGTLTPTALEATGRATGRQGQTFQVTAGWSANIVPGAPNTLRIAPGTALRIEFDYALAVSTASDAACGFAYPDCESAFAYVAFGSTGHASHAWSRFVFATGPGLLADETAGHFSVDLENRTDADIYQTFSIELIAEGAVPVVVPEASTAVLLGAGLLALGLRGARSRRSRA